MSADVRRGINVMGAPAAAEPRFKEFISTRVRSAGRRHVFKGEITDVLSTT
jgi:hypothetical protein